MKHTCRPVFLWKVREALNMNINTVATSNRLHTNKHLHTSALFLTVLLHVEAVVRIVGHSNACRVLNQLALTGERGPGVSLALRGMVTVYGAD